MVFTTYQSGKVIAKASNAAKYSFDLGIMDEAHKTVGNRDKSFAYLLFDDNIKIYDHIKVSDSAFQYASQKTNNII